MKAILIGFGRAGRRLGQGLDALGVEWVVVEPDEQAVPEGKWVWGHPDYYFTNPSNYFADFAIIATPPALHLSQIRLCLDAGLPVLCEKPLCTFGQLAEAESLLSHPLSGKVGIAFNYRWHPRIDKLAYHRVVGDDSTPCLAISAQYRPELPEWGLILDHLPHTVDTLLWLTGAKTMTVDQANHRKTSEAEVITAQGLLDDKTRWKLSDAVYSHPTDKVAWLDGPFGPTQVETPPETVDRMTQAMLAQWIDFVRGEGEYPAKLWDGVRVQRILEEVREKL